ncbi:MAG TPA: tRNA pseudouridine(13) synthase TruD, partial [Pseudomonadales bacterium]|nr:tRNA pseudouridine(13) synthase TruD [Pseudomonadales bacterium]
MTEPLSPIEHLIEQNLLDTWPRAYSAGVNEVATATIKKTPEDFVVSEILGFEPSGEGEHVLLWIEKAGFNSEYLAKKIAKLAGVKPFDVGYCGMKDRHAVTRQWYSVHLPGKPAPDWRHLEGTTLKVLRAERHNKKLKRGIHEGNHFEIILRDIQGDKAHIETLLLKTKEQGTPNYFGPQRFGKE